MIGKNVEAKEEGGKIGGQEDMEEVRPRMVVVSGERVRSGQCMLPSRVVWCESGGWGMKSVTVQGVGQNLDERALNE